ncbi:hypothetical protein ACET3Z_025700 [Daucus carota]
MEKVERNHHYKMLKRIVTSKAESAHESAEAGEALMSSECNLKSLLSPALLLLIVIVLPLYKPCFMMPLKALKDELKNNVDSMTTILERCLC